MDQEQAKHFGGYIQTLRKQRHLSMRELATRSGINSGPLSRLEQGKVASPKPETLKALAKTLDVPLVVLFDAAGYTTACGTPCLTHHLAICYGHLPKAAREAIDAHVEKVMHKHGITHPKQHKHQS